MAKKPANPRLGIYITGSLAGEPYKAYVPPPLPPKPPVEMTGLARPLEKAMQALGELNGLGKLIPDVGLYLFMYARKEAVLSSQIEGTQSSLDDLLLFESGQPARTPVDDVEEVSNYVAALNHALRRIKNGFPLSTRLVRESHAILLRGGRGANKMPGAFRRTQNWIGGAKPGRAKFVPPPPDKVTDLVANLETFIHGGTAFPVLIRAALLHVQFESIHPFLDGNGRLGRLLIVLLLCAEGLLDEPLLFLSLYFKTHREVYYEALQAVRKEGDWEGWCEFFLDGVTETAKQGVEEGKRILKLVSKDRARLEGLNRAAPTALRIHTYMLKSPYLSLTRAAKKLKISAPAITNAVMKMVELGVLKEMTGRKRGRVFAYEAYRALLNEGTDPFAARKSRSV